MPLLVIPQGAGIPVLDVSGLLGDLYPYLGARAAEDLSFWTVDELYRAVNEAAGRLAVAVPAWIERDNLGDVAATLDLPERCVQVIHCTSGVTALRRVSVAALDALDETWQTTTDDYPSYFTEDMEAGDRIRLYPAPEEPEEDEVLETVTLVFQTKPESVSSDQPILVANRTIGDYLALDVLADARSKEGKAAIPETAEYAKGLAGLLKQAFTAYWGLR